VGDPDRDLDAACTPASRLIHDGDDVVVALQNLDELVAEVLEASGLGGTDR
jgi:hypothetical protein